MSPPITLQGETEKNADWLLIHRVVDSLMKQVPESTCLSFRVTEDSVGLRRILSHSTESLNFRSRTLSMESLTDDGLSFKLFMINILIYPIFYDMIQNHKMMKLYFSVG